VREAYTQPQKGQGWQGSLSERTGRLLRPAQPVGKLPALPQGREARREAYSGSQVKQG